MKLRYKVIDLFHNGDQIWYSFVLMLMSPISLAAMGTIQKNVSTKVRPVGLIKGWFPYDRRRSRIADRGSQKVLRSYAIIWKRTSAIACDPDHRRSQKIEPCSIFCDRLRSSAILRSCGNQSSAICDRNVSHNIFNSDRCFNVFFSIKPECSIIATLICFKHGWY